MLNTNRPILLHIDALDPRRFLILNSSQEVKMSCEWEFILFILLLNLMADISQAAPSATSEFIIFITSWF